MQVGIVGIKSPAPAPVSYYSCGGRKANVFGDQHMHGPEGLNFYTRTKVATSRWPDPRTSASASASHRVVTASSRLQKGIVKRQFQYHPLESAPYMKRSWLALLCVVVLGLLAGAAVAGRPTTVDDTVITFPPSTTTTTAPTATLPTDSVAETPSTSTALSFDPGTLQVVVANGTDIAGIASATADALVAAGFSETRAVDSTAAIAVTVVFARRGFEAAALAVAAELGLDATAVLALPNTPVTTDDAAADVIVAIGDDFPT